MKLMQALSGYVAHYTRDRVGVALVGGTTVAYTILFIAMVFLASLAGTTGESAVFGPADSDSRIYVDLARVMLDEGRFAMTAASSPETFRTPAYSGFLALILAASGSWVAIICAQILLTALTVGIIYALGKRFFSPHVGFAAGALYALDPTVMLKTFMTYTEGLFVFSLVFAAFLLIAEPQTKRRLLLGGLFLGLAALTRPIGLFIAPIFLAWLVWRNRYALHAGARALAVVLLGIALVTVPWMTRNALIAGHFSLSSLGTYNALFANVAEFESYATGKSKEAVWSEMKGRLDEDGVLGAHHDFVYHDRERALIFEYMEGEWFSYALFHAIKTVPFFVGSSLEAAVLALHQQEVLKGEAPPDSNLTAAILSGDMGTIGKALAAHPLITVEYLFWMMIWVLAALSMILLRGEKRGIATFFLILAFTFAVLTGPISMPPYRMPAEPFIFLLAAASLGAFYRIYAAYRAKRGA